MFRQVIAARSLWYVAALLLAVFIYFFGLDGQHIPRNGDEDVYTHITRMTAESGRLLPLQSGLNNMRNTKPPLLFWQGIVSTHGGESWDRWHLRYPSVIYTLLTALLVLLLGRRLSGKFETGAIAALMYLAFFSTYRYGRPFLVNPAETFWLFLPFFTLLYWRPFSFESHFRTPLLLGLAIGIGLLYKSFALLAPVGLALAWWYLHQRRYQWRSFLRKDVFKPVLAGTIALGLFSLWFVLDPDPQAVWREFVVGENAGKLAAGGDSYLKQLLWGGNSIWALLAGYPLNAGLLSFPVAALFFVAYRRRWLLSDPEIMLWIWVVTLFAVFAIPGQRSARYLLDAMPAIALLCALNWQRIPRWAFSATLVMTAALLLLLGYLAARLQYEAGGLYGWSDALLLAGALVLVLLGLGKAAWTRGLACTAALLASLVLALFLRPFDGAMGVFPVEAQSYVRGKEVWVPCNFRANDEGHRFLLPGARIHGYHENWDLAQDELAARYRLFALQLPPSAEPCKGCKVIGQRLEIRGRHSGDELRAMLRGAVYEHLFVREWLLESPRAKAAVQPRAEGCR